MIGRIYVGDHHTLLQSKYVSCFYFGDHYTLLKCKYVFIQISLVILRPSYDHVQIVS